jgi:hypothetical protein
MHLKDVLREIKPDRGNFVHGRLPFGASSTVTASGANVGASSAPSGWRAGVYPRSADLPILRRYEIQACDQDEAVIEAMDRVDGLLRL